MFGSMEPMNDEFHPSSQRNGNGLTHGAGDMLTRGRHVRRDLQPHELYGAAADHGPVDGVTRGRHLRADLPSGPDSSDASQADDVPRARHARGVPSDPDAGPTGTTDDMPGGSTLPVIDPRVLGTPLDPIPYDEPHPGSVAVLTAPLVEVPAPPDRIAIATEATDFLRFSRTRRLTRLQFVITVVLLVLVAAGASYWWVKVRNHGTPVGPQARVAVVTTGLGTVVTLTKGSDTLPQLRQALSQSGHAGLITSVPGGAVELNANIVVGRGATLDVTQSALVLRSAPLAEVQVSTQGGKLDFVDDTITSWTTQGQIDTDAVAGRADIIAIGAGAELNFSNSRVVGLGTDANSPGISWTNGASGTVQDSHFSQDWRALSAYQSGPLTITGSSFDHSQDAGALLIDPGAGSVIKNNTFAHNTRSGLELDGTVRHLTLADNTADDNKYAGLQTTVTQGHVTLTNGLFYNNGRFGVRSDGGRLSLVGTKAWANATGLYINGGSNTLHGADLSSNTNYGMYVTGVSAKVKATADRFDHNSGAGVWVANGQVTLTAGLLDENLTGIRIVGISHYFRAAGNSITDNLKDGVALNVSPDITIRGNVIDDNGASAISTDKTYDVKRLFKQNKIANNQTATRIRAG
jgi:hypothetical protein